jgi:hypothetical protein
MRNSFSHRLSRLEITVAFGAAAARNADGSRGVLDREPIAVVSRDERSKTPLREVRAKRHSCARNSLRRTNGCGSVARSMAAGTERCAARKTP